MADLGLARKRERELEKKMKRRHRNGRVGSSLEDLLKGEGIFEETRTKAVKEVVAWQRTKAMKSKRISKGRTKVSLGTTRT